MNAVRKAMTETVWLDGRTETFTLSGVAVNVADPKIELLDPNVDIRVEIVEKKRTDTRIPILDLKRYPYLAHHRAAQYHR
jgi:hypothetical protein